jgi:hypothetical protein
MTNADKSVKKTDEIKTPYDTESEESFDAKVMEEEIEMGDRQAPSANVESDYENAKKFSEPATDSEQKADSL